MGMDLRPARPTKDAPLRADGKVKWGRYSIGGWYNLIFFLKEQGADAAAFSIFSDGGRIKAADCKKVADVIEANFDAYVVDQGGTLGNEEDVKVCKLDILLWRTCGGYRQH